MSQALRSTFVLALATVLEAVRSRVLLTALAFALVLIGLSVSAASVSIGERARLILDVGLAAASGLGTVIAVALTITSFAREIERRTAYPVLARPVSRSTFLFGKFLGLWLTMSLVTTLMLLATALVAYLYSGSIPGALAWAFPLAALEMGVVIAVALLFSSFATPVLASTYTLALLIAGNLAEDVRLVARRLAEQPAAAALVRTAYHLLPDVEALSVRVQAANDLLVPASYVGTATAYALAYALALLAASMLVFSRKASL